MRFFSIKKFPPFLYTKSVPPPCILSSFLFCVFMPTDNNTNLGFTPCFWLILRYAHGLYGKVLSRSRALSYSKNTTGNLFTTENAEISNDFWKRRTQLYCMYCKRAFFKKRWNIGVLATFVLLSVGIAWNNKIAFFKNVPVNSGDFFARYFKKSSKIARKNCQKVQKFENTPYTNVFLYVIIPLVLGSIINNNIQVLRIFLWKRLQLSI